jgi:hypothetical protein
MAIATIKILPFRYANFVHLDVPAVKGNPPPGEDIALDVGEAFPTDQAAADFWDELKEGWIMHCRQRRTSGEQHG